MIEQDMDLEKVISSRRTIHEFTMDAAPDQALVQEAISFACWAPNHHLTEPWHFYLLGKETIQSVCELNREMLIETKGIEAAEKKYKRWMDIPGWLVVTCMKSEDEVRYMEDYAACSCAIQNMMLFLWDKGIGMKWSTGPVVRDTRFYDLVWINPELEQVIGLFWYGYPAEIPQTVRKPVLQVLTELP